MTRKFKNKKTGKILDLHEKKDKHLIKTLEEDPDFIELELVKL